MCFSGGWQPTHDMMAWYTDSNMLLQWRVRYSQHQQLSSTIARVTFALLVAFYVYIYCVLYHPLCVRLSTFHVFAMFSIETSQCVLFALRHFGKLVAVCCRARNQCHGTIPKRNQINWYLLYISLIRLFIVAYGRLARTENYLFSFSQYKCGKSKQIAYTNLNWKAPRAKKGHIFGQSPHFST